MNKTTKITHASIAILLIGVALTFAFIATRPASAQTVPAPTAAGGSLDQRIAQRKAERKITLVEKDQQRILNTCINSQGKIRALQAKTATAMINRSKAYQQVDAKVWMMIGKLKLVEKDTFNLEKQRSELAEKSKNFQTTSGLYQQVLDDTVVINCKADPVGFKSLLETARIYRQQLRDQATDIREYSINNIKPSLDNFAGELQVKPATEENN